MLNPVREGEEDNIKAIRYRRRLKIFENFLFEIRRLYPCGHIYVVVFVRMRKPVKENKSVGRLKT